jgi:hypothetical protein
VTLQFSYSVVFIISSKANDINSEKLNLSGVYFMGNLMNKGWQSQFKYLEIADF